MSWTHKVTGAAAMAVTATVPLAALGTPASGAAAGTAPAASAPAQVRVNQVGYTPAGSKEALAMLPAVAGRVSFTVSDGRHVVFRGTSTEDAGRWNANYPATYALDFGGLTRPGTYRITVTAPGVLATSPAFRIAAPGALYSRLVTNAVRYFTSERDGADVVPSVLSRQPANLTDRRATVYATPSYDASDNLTGTFHRVGGPVDVSGGWFDAGGGYEKFAYTGSYADGLMLLAARDFPGRYRTLAPEATFGLDWLTKLWNPARKVLYIQVGIGNGNASDTIQGDYDYWFLPQQEDRLGAAPGSPAYYVEYRPVFEAAPPGQRIDPDFAGRFAADFALGAQLAARTDPARARTLLALARSVYAMAKTSGVGSLVTAFPHDYYPGSQWKSDMLWGAAEIALASEALHAPAPAVKASLATAVSWARAYITQGHPAGGDTFNLYDTGAVGEAELLAALHGARMPPGDLPGQLPGQLLGDLAAQLTLAEHNAAGDPFALGLALGSGDATPHAFGLYITNALYQRSGGSGRFAAFAQQQLNFALGANGWGSSFVVGAGSTFPHCLQSEIANLSGSLTGAGPIQLGATVDGPSDPANFEGLSTVDGMRSCSAGSYAPFSTAAAAYEDNVVSWPSVEPADDYTATSLLAFALAAR
ncbi:MAG TPA: glycoside hydrolase family 9 protein [Streptosporangiaceae bacterium]|nr:glycoside hydrolase family 9 protein [Streptosporangiaceae bacterium]